MEILDGFYRWIYAQCFENYIRHIVGKRRVRHVVVVTLRIYHFAAAGSIVVDVFIGGIAVGHYWVVAIGAYAVLVPYLQYAQRYSRAKLMVL